MLTGRVDRTRLDHVDVDPVRIELGGDRESELIQTPFAGVIGDAADIGRVSVSAGDEDDLSAPPRWTMCLATNWLI